MAAEQEEHRLREERSRQQADELLEELEEEERKEAEIKRVQEEKKRKKAKANAKNAKLEEERAARDRAEQEAAAQVRPIILSHAGSQLVLAASPEMHAGDSRNWSALMRLILAHLLPAWGLHI